jgi:predicted nucleic acid-binding protein
MEIAIDASAIIAVILNEAQKKELIEQSIGANLIAPQSVFWEIGNAFSAMLKRDRLTLANAKLAIAIFHEIPIRYVDIDMKSSLEIAAGLKIYAYDAYLLQCAVQYRSPLMTLDKSLARLAEQTGIKVIEV